MSRKWTTMMLRERIDIIEKAEQWRQISLRIWTSWNLCWRQCWNHQESEAKLPKTSRSPSAHGCGTRSIQDKDIHAGHDAVVVNLWEAVSEDMVANLFKQGDFRQAGASASICNPPPNGQHSRKSCATLKHASIRVTSPVSQVVRSFSFSFLNQISRACMPSPDFSFGYLMQMMCKICGLETIAPFYSWRKGYANYLSMQIKQLNMVIPPHFRSSTLRGRRSYRRMALHLLWAFFKWYDFFVQSYESRIIKVPL